jgi:16S rRNA (guanine527-N7)-methyltransferase
VVSPAECTRRLERYLEALLRKNRELNLTAIRDAASARILHVQDSLEISALGLSPRCCLDLGSGNGFPGVALRLLYPDARVCLMDRSQKKLRAIAEILEEVELGAVELLHLDAVQAPSLRPDLRQGFDLIAARALGKPETVAALSRPLLAAKGHLVLWLDKETAAPKKLCGLTLWREHHYELPEPAARHRRLACYRSRSWS